MPAPTPLPPLRHPEATSYCSADTYATGLRVSLACAAAIGAAALAPVAIIGPSPRVGLALAFVPGSLVAAAVFLACWSAQITRNLAALGRAPRFSPRWAAAVWFVPIVSLFRPKQVVAEVWRTSCEHPSGDDTGRESTLLGWWWGFVVASHFLWPAWPVAMALTYVVVGRVTDRQDRHAARLGLLPSPGRPRRSAGAAIVGGLASVAAVSGAVIAVNAPEESARGSDRRLVGDLPVEDVPVDRLPVGTCFDDTASIADFKRSASAVLVLVGPIFAVDCLRAHDNEVYARTPHPLARLADHPTEDELSTGAIDACFAEFDAWAGIEYERSALEVLAVWPTKARWHGGDRNVVCIAYRLDFAKLSGSTRGAGI